MGARSLAAQAHPCWIIGASAVVNILKNVPSKCRGKSIGKKHKKTGSGSRGNKKTQLEKRGLKKGGNVWGY